MRKDGREKRKRRSDEGREEGKIDERVKRRGDESRVEVMRVKSGRKGGEVRGEGERDKKWGEEEKKAMKAQKKRGRDGRKYK